MTETPVTCQVPKYFMAIELGGPAERAAAVLAGVSGGGDLVARTEAFAQELLANHSCYGALFALPPGRPAYFVITEPQGMPADLAALSTHLPGEARSVELPCGPALTCTRRESLPGSAGGLVQEHAFVVHPAGRLVAFTMGVQDDQRRPEDAHLFAEILSTVSFSG